ncbi:MAG TPA: hypothetical protein VFK05_22365 [Polyangiaceae bacterium]|nr:hypothetical protein [Polyangiaceae bacterium]
MPNSEPAGGAPVLRRFWLRLFAFFTLLALGWAGLELGVSRMANSHAVKHRQLRALANEIDTLILGSSETYYGISAHELSGTAFNLANWSQSLYFDYELTKRVVPELPKLKRVILLVNYMSLYYELDDHPESWRQYDYLREWGIPLQRPIDYLNLGLVSRVALYTPHAAMEALLRGFRGDRAPHVDDRGWYRVPDEDRWGVGPDQAKRRLGVHHGFMHQQYFSGNAAKLEQLVVFLRGRGLEVVLLTTPVWDTYRAGIRENLWQPTRTLAGELARKHGARYLNLQHEPRLRAEEFEDPDHLNADGAVHFARILDETLGPPALAKATQPSVTLAGLGAP